mmetsp:Transcript_18606/g.44947  ORF Transcript_18606/g.44947 Transcript_18606/m.44947 type:complete len:89 (-) Transcript_18606:454-720(-)
MMTLKKMTMEETTTIIVKVKGMATIAKITTMAAFNMLTPSKSNKTMASATRLKTNTPAREKKIRFKDVQDRIAPYILEDRKAGNRHNM